MDLSECDRGIGRTEPFDQTSITIGVNCVVKVQDRDIAPGRASNSLVQETRTGITPVGLDGDEPGLAAEVAPVEAAKQAPHLSDLSVAEVLQHQRRFER